METSLPDPSRPLPADSEAADRNTLDAQALVPALSRRGFLRGAVVGGGGLLAAGVAACTSAPIPSWTFGPGAPTPGTASPPPSPSAAASVSASVGPSPSASASPSASPGSGAIPSGWSQHDIDSRRVIRRYLGNLAPLLRDVYPAPTFAALADILAVEEGYPELTAKPAFARVSQLVLNDAVSPLTPELDGAVKVFRLTVEELDQRIDELMPPVRALGFGGRWPGPTIRVREGDRVRVIFTNRMGETTGVHFHGVEFDDFLMDGVPFVTQKPIGPGESFAYEFTASRPGSLMYHSHHNATDQVGRGLLGAFVVEPKVDTVRADREYVWISNDTLGGFTINGHGFPATVPVVAASGERVLIRFMNEGIMMHPWHLHGYRMRIVARDGYPLGGAAFDCDTLGVNPGERFDALIEVDRPGIWAFHCHILPHAEAMSGMFGMVNTLVVVPKRAHVDAILESVLA